MDLSVLCGLGMCSAACTDPGDSGESARIVAVAAESVSQVALDTGISPDGTTVDSTEAIQAWIDQDFYSDADIQRSFHSIFGEQVDCIDFYAQHSVRMRVARGISVTMPPSPPPVRPDFPVLDADFYAGVDEDGNKRGCVSPSVATMRPTVAQIQSSGGIVPWRLRGAPPRDQNENTSQPDCVQRQG